MASRKKLKRRIRKLQARRSLPREILGVKIPGSVRRAADTPLGSALLAATIMQAAGAALSTPAVRKLRRQAQALAMLAAHQVSAVTQDAAAAISDAFEPDPPPNTGKRKTASKSRARQSSAVTH